MHVINDAIPSPIALVSDSHFSSLYETCGAARGMECGIGVVCQGKSTQT